MRKYIIFAAIAAVLVGLLVFMGFRYKSISGENERLRNNIEYYSSTEQSDLTLRLTVDELRESRDSLIMAVDSLRKELSIKPKTLQTITMVETRVHDTLYSVVEKTADFKTVVKPNDLTSIEITKTDTLLTVIPDIRNEQALYITKESRYKYKGFFNRLVHLNFKKITADRYHIVNTNDLISVGDTRVINITK